MPASQPARFRASQGAHEGRRGGLNERIKPAGAPGKPTQKAGQVQDEIDQGHALKVMCGARFTMTFFAPPASRCTRLSYIIFNSVSAISEGVVVTPMPAALKAAILAAAV